jgi:hypothetical protein
MVTDPSTVEQFLDSFREELLTEKDIDVSLDCLSKYREVLANAYDDIIGLEDVIEKRRETVAGDNNIKDTMNFDDDLDTIVIPGMEATVLVETVEPDETTTEPVNHGSDEQAEASTPPPPVNRFRIFVEQSVLRPVR